MSKQTFCFRTNNPSANTTCYLDPFGTGIWENVEDQVLGICAADGEISNLSIELFAAPGVGNSLVVALLINGVASALSCSFGAADVGPVTSAGPVSVAVGDRLSFRFTGTSGPTLSNMYFSYDFDGDNDGESIHGSSTNAAISITRTGPLFGANNGTNMDGTESIVAVQGTITSLQARVSAVFGPAASGTYVFAIIKNGVTQDGGGGTVDTRVTITAGGALTGSSTFSLNVSPGDRLRISVTPTTVTTTQRLQYGILYLANTTGQNNYWSNGDNNTPSGAAGPIFRPAEGSSEFAWVATEANSVVKVGLSGFILSGLQVGINLTTAGTPTYTFRTNGGSTAIEVGFDASSTTGSDIVDTITMTTGNTCAVQLVQTTSAAARRAIWSFIQGPPSGAVVTLAKSIPYMGGFTGATFVD